MSKEKTFEEEELELMQSNTFWAGRLIGFDQAWEVADEIIKFAEDHASQKCKEAEKKAYIDGTNACHKAFQPLLKSALKEQREICAEVWIRDDNYATSDFNSAIIVRKIKNAPSPTD